MTGYEKSPDYGGPAVRPWRLAIGVAVFLGATALAWKAFALPLCGGGPRTDCVVDGDTIWLAGEKIRLEGIDAPELSRAKCPEELRIATSASARMVELTEGELTVSRNGKDRYGRTLANVANATGDIGETLVAEGLAKIWEGRKAQWCE